MSNRVEPHYMESSAGRRRNAADTGEQLLKPFVMLAEGAEQVIQQGLPLAMSLAPQLAGAAGLGLGPIPGMAGTGSGMGGGSDFQAQLMLLEKQKQIQFEGQLINTMTNISKADHEARMSVIRGIRP